MAERILKFGGIDPLSRSDWDTGDAEPDSDPRGRQGTEIVRGMHMMSAVEQLEPCATTSMAYLGPESSDMDLGEIEEAVREGRLSLEDVMTKTNRFTPLVNPRRSRKKDTGELTADSDTDLWHVPTSNYNAITPRSIFRPLAGAIDGNDSVDNSGVYGEFRERRNGGEVFGHVWFDDFDVGAIDGDPVRLGFKFGWNYFGDRAFFYQPFAQRTRCKNSVRALDSKQVVMHHNKDPNFGEKWSEALRDLGLYGDALSQQIQTASELEFVFESDLAPDEAGDMEVPVPMSLESFYEHIGLPDPRIPADHAREESGGDGVSAWHLHNGATYWLSWHWNGSEDSQAFRQYRRTADDLLINPHQMASRVRDSYTESERQRIIREVAGADATMEDLDEEERAEVERRITDHDGIARVQTGVESLEGMVEQFEETEERLDRIEAQMGGD